MNVKYRIIWHPFLFWFDWATFLFDTMSLDVSLFVRVLLSSYLFYKWFIFTNQLLGGTYLAALLKAATTTNDIRETLSTYFPNDIEFQCPWGLILGGIGSVLILVSAVWHLYILSMYRTNDDAQNPYTTIAPPGYNSTVGLKIPLVDSMGKKEEAVYFSQWYK